uniref:LRAT domain-containing protein n=1 Tax=Strongyloides venezuelensis TaxID=75913 RepID=A0A0K0EUZ5_STRVS
MGEELVTPWGHVEDLLGILQPGDNLECKVGYGSGNGFFQHWGTYIGTKNNIHEVVHYSKGEIDIEDEKSHATSFSSCFKINGKEGSIQIDNLYDFSGKCLVRINNSMDKNHKPFPKVVIIERAKRRVGETEYDILTNNCEHFAKWARYGLSISKQAIFAETMMIFFVVGTFTKIMIMIVFIHIPVALAITITLSICITCCIGGYVLSLFVPFV